MTNGKKDIKFLRELVFPGRLETLEMVGPDSVPKGLLTQLVRGFVAADLAMKDSLEDYEVSSEGTTEGVESTCDVLVICPMANELEMTCLAFGADYERPTRVISGTKEFDVTIQSSLNNLDIGITIAALNRQSATLNRQTNVTAASRTRSLIARNRPQVSLLTGIGATPAGNTFGHVVAIDTVNYPESRVREADHDDPRTLHYDVNPESQTELDNFKRRCDRTSWRKDALTRSLELKKEVDGVTPLVKEVKSAGFKCGMKKAMSGEALRKDGKIAEEASNINQLVQSVEMEAYGFAEASKEAGLPWFVFRGHCDFGDADETDLWQLMAALNSAICARSFLETEHTLPSAARF